MFKLKYRNDEKRWFMTASFCVAGNNMVKGYKELAERYNRFVGGKSGMK